MNIYRVREDEDRYEKPQEWQFSKLNGDHKAGKRDEAWKTLKEKQNLLN